MMRIVATKRFRFRGGWAVPGDIMEVPRRRGAFLTRHGRAFNLDIGGVSLGVGGGGPGAGGIPEMVGATSRELLAEEGLDSFDLDLPLATQEGDLLVTFVCVPGNREISDAPSGWSDLARFSANPTADHARLEVWTKTAGDSEPGAYTWTASLSSQNITSCLVAIRSEGTPSIPVGGFSTEAQGQEPETLVVPETTMPDEGLLLGAFASSRTAQPRTMTNPEDMTSRFTNLVNRNSALRVSDQVVEAGPTGSRSSTKVPINTFAGTAGILIQVVG